MWRLSHFGQIYECTGTIGQALQAIPDVASSVGNQTPFIGAQQSDLNGMPGPNQMVTFRPKMSGKA